MTIVRWRSIIADGGIGCHLLPEERGTRRNLPGKGREMALDRSWKGSIVEHY
jgi:hypothetical protein